MRKDSAWKDQEIDRLVKENKILVVKMEELVNSLNEMKERVFRFDIMEMDNE